MPKKVILGWSLISNMYIFHKKASNYKVDNFLTTPNYQQLYNNLYHNWTVDNNFYYTINFKGDSEEIPDLSLSMRFLADYSFMRYITTLLPVDQQREFSKLSVTSEFYKLLATMGSDVD